jgi:hypothetical protein
MLLVPTLLAPEKRPTQSDFFPAAWAEEMAIMAKMANKKIFFIVFFSWFLGADRTSLPALPS